MQLFSVPGRLWILQIRYQLSHITAAGLHLHIIGARLGDEIRRPEQRFEGARIGPPAVEDITRQLSLFDVGLI